MSCMLNIWPIGFREVRRNPYSAGLLARALPFRELECDSTEYGLCSADACTLLAQFQLNFCHTHVTEGTVSLQ